MLLFCKCASIR